jgi:hypothetical protein
LSSFKLSGNDKALKEFEGFNRLTSIGLVGVRSKILTSFLSES